MFCGFDVLFTHAALGIWYLCLSHALLVGLCRQKLMSDIFVYAVNNVSYVFPCAMDRVCIW